MENLLSIAEIYQQYESVHLLFKSKEGLWDFLSHLTVATFIGCTLFSIAFLMAIIFKLLRFNSLKGDNFKELFTWFSSLAGIALFSYFALVFAIDKKEEISNKKYETFFHALTMEHKQVLNKEMYIYLSTQRDVELHNFKFINTFDKELLKNKIKNNSGEQLFGGEEFRYFLGSETIGQVKSYKKILSKEKEGKVREELDNETRKELENNFEKTESQSKDCIMFCPSLK